MKNTEKLNRFVLWMQAKNMAYNTIKIYKSFLIKFFDHANEDSARISGRIIQNYILQIPKELSNSYRNQAINAIRLYFLIVERKKINVDFMPRPVHQQFVPNILSVEQIEKVVFNTKNLKHRAILFTIYDNGLRISELVNLKLMDLRTKNQSTPHLIIRETKYHKTRIVPVSDRFVNLMREYYLKYRPKNYLFEGDKPDMPYSRTSIRNILVDALKRENIKFKIRVHDLRHSFVTHCLANETPINHMAPAIGHSSCRTTEKYYSHLSFTQLQIHRPNTSQQTEVKLKICG